MAITEVRLHLESLGSLPWRAWVRPGIMSVDPARNQESDGTVEVGLL